MKDTSNSSDLLLDENDKRCAPHIEFKHGSCISLENLILLATTYNNYTKKNVIKLNNNKETIDSRRYKKYLLKQFNETFKDKCTTQTCWLKQDFIKEFNRNTKEELQKYTFRPKGPEGQFEWLNTFNIDNVMNQYEEVYKDFFYMGTVPMDFDDIDAYKIRTFNFKQFVDKGITKFGIVFNLDDSTQGGSHWVAGYYDVKKGHIYYFDSYGIRPEERVQKLMRRVANFCIEEMGIPKNKLVTSFNKTRHQYGNSECGMYSIYFILNMLEGKDFEKFNKNKIQDMVVNKFRDTVFHNTNIREKYEKNLTKNKNK